MSTADDLKPLAFGPFGSPLHALFVALGAVVAAAVFIVGARRHGLLSEDTAMLVAGALGGGALGAKLAVVWRFVETDGSPSLVGFLLRGGQSVLGGLAGAYLGVVLVKRFISHRAANGDLFAPAAALGIGIGRFGCLLTETPGTPTGARWGVVVDAGRAARIVGFPPGWIGVPLHPSFAYEIPFHFVMAAVLFRLRARGVWRGALFKLYCLAYALFRFQLEFVRGNPVVWRGLTLSQLFLIPSALLLALALVGRLRWAQQPEPDARPT